MLKRLLAALLLLPLAACAELLPGTDRLDGSTVLPGADAARNDATGPGEDARVGGDAAADGGEGVDGSSDAALPDAEMPDTGIHRDGGPLRLVEGRLTTTSSASGAPLRLREHGFELDPRRCGPSGTPCAEGGLTP
ncbi:MAG: hypothetical protein IT384_28055 [Deltaproteobacteria bacterium]|nr:hypothetical protein [Deltaproteobacteria bacterium]